MGKWKHRLTEVNKTDKTATCAHCGENTSIRVWASTGKVACRTRVNEAKSRETRVRISSPESKERRNASRHGLTYVQYKEMLDKGCAVCSSKENLCIDHDHSCCPDSYSCGSCVRGILCASCNKAEGLLNSDPERVLALYEYLKKSPPTL